MFEAYEGTPRFSKEAFLSRFPLGLVAVVAALWMLPSVPVAQAYDECGGSSTFADRYSAYSNTGSYTQGAIVTTGTGGTLRLWEAGSTVSGTPGQPGASGWTDVTTQHASKTVTCNAAVGGAGSGLSPLDADTNIRYDESDVAIIYDNPGTIYGIHHTGNKAAVEIRQGSVVHRGPPTGGAIRNGLAIGASAAVYLKSSSGDVRLTTSAGTSVTNSGVHTLSGPFVRHGIRASANNGNLYMTLAGDTSTASRGVYNIIGVVSGSTSNIDIDITGGTHTSTGEAATVVSVGVNDPATFPASTIDIDITNQGTVLSSSGSMGNVVLASSSAGVSSITIGSGVMLCAGEYTSSSRTCAPRGAGGYAIEVKRGAATSGGASQITNAGLIGGDIRSNGGARPTTLTNSGTIIGSFFSTNSPSTVTNTGTWIMTKDSNFGSGSDTFNNRGTLVLRYSNTPIVLTALETFTQATGATLRIELDPSRGISCSGGATYNAAARCGAETVNYQADRILPGPNASMISVGSASGTINGHIEVVSLNTVADADYDALHAALNNPTYKIRPVFHTSHGLTLGSSLTVGQGLTKCAVGRNLDNDNCASRVFTENVYYDFSEIPKGQTPAGLPAAPAPIVRGPSDPQGPNPPGVGVNPDLGNPDGGRPGGTGEGPRFTSSSASAYTYDAVVQASWFASRALLRASLVSECGTLAEDAFSPTGAPVAFLDGGCAWTKIGGRFTSHDRGSADVQESVFTLLSGLQVPLVSFMGYQWDLIASAAYEHSGLDLGSGDGEGNRGLVSILASARGEELPLSFTVGMTVNGGAYEVSHGTSSGAATGEPSVVAVGGHGGAGYLFIQPLGDFGEVAIVPRIQMDIVGLFLGSFTETLTNQRVGDLQETMVSFTPSVEFGRDDQTIWGTLQSRLEVGLVAFATDPELDYDVNSVLSKGTMEQLFAEVSFGATMLQGNRTEFSVVWDGLFGADTANNSILLKARYAF